MESTSASSPSWALPVKDVTIGLCNDFRSHILSLRVKQKEVVPKSPPTPPPDIGQHSKPLPKMGIQRGLLNENINDHLKPIHWRRSKNQTPFEIEGKSEDLLPHPAKVDVLKRASLFAGLTKGK